MSIIWQLTDGQGPVYDVEVEFENYQLTYGRKDRLSYSKDKKTLLQIAVPFRIWTGTFQLDRKGTPGKAEMLSLFETRYLYLSEDQGLTWTKIYWSDNWRVQYESPDLDFMGVFFKFVEFLEE
jgi:hypothetical protein